MLNYFVSPSRFRTLTLVTAIVTFALVVLGGIVRVTGSGLSCLDWPFCTQPLPDDHIKPALEMGHRFVAAVVTALIALVAVSAWRGYRRHKWIFRPAMLGSGGDLLPDHPGRDHGIAEESSDHCRGALRRGTDHAGLRHDRRDSGAPAAGSPASASAIGPSW